MTLPSRKKIEEAIAELKDLKSHSCDEGEDMEYGIYNCCGNSEYKGHEESCTRIKSLDYALLVLTALKDGEIVAKPVVTDEWLDRVMPKEKENIALTSSEPYQCHIVFDDGLVKIGNEEEAKVYNQALADCREAIRRGL